MHRFSLIMIPRITLGLALLLSIAPILVAQDATAPPPSPSAGALNDTIWFDADQDALIPIEVEPRDDDSLNRESRWLPKAKRVRVPEASSGQGGTTGGGIFGGSGLFGTDLTLGNLLGWLLLATLVGLAVFAIAHGLSKSEFDFGGGPTARSARRPSGPDQQTLERMKHLPAELRRTDVNLRSEAERLMLEGNYDQAIILLFAHQLLLLDRAGLLRLNRGKTNRRYVREARSADRATAEWLQATVNAFERSYFGRHSISAAEFAALWTDNQSLEQSVQSRPEVAA